MSMVTIRMVCALAASTLASGVADSVRAAVPCVADAQGAQGATGGASLVVDGATIVDVEQGKLLQNQRVLIVGNRIQAVGDMGVVKMPNGAQVVNAKGKYLLPGLWDMHTHVGDMLGDPSLPDSFYRANYPRYIANGITAIRDMAQRWPGGADSFRVWQRDVLAGRRVGPRSVGPSADLGTPVMITNGDEARIVVDSLKAAGDAFIKYHDSYGDRGIFFAVLREARKADIPVVGHIPASVTNIEAADSGMRSIEHVSEQRCGGEAGIPEPGVDSAALDAACAPVAQAYLRNGTWLTPTLVAYWLGQPVFRLNSSEDAPPAEHDEKYWESLLRPWRTLRRLGVRNFLAGSDWITRIAEEHYGPEYLPGLSAREEIVLLTGAGLTPLEALQAATRNPAIFFSATDSLGSVASGKLADLVLLDGDPLADITNVLKLWGVVANGRYFDHAELVAMDPDAFMPERGFVAPYLTRTSDTERAADSPP